jgi:RNA recognition motif-containing protein
VHRFAYVDFKSEDLQRIAIGLSEKMFEGRRVLIKLGMSRSTALDSGSLRIGNDYAAKPDARTPKPERVKTEGDWILKKQVHSASSTLFVGNLPFDATEEALRDMIEGNAKPKAEVKVEGVIDDEGITEKEEKEDGDNEVEGVDGETEEKEVVKEPFISARGGRKAGLRKVRLGAFEDTGRCKG